ncbi:hypothetical protein JCM8097_004337 [Rhodosporidiobolus ruineniae]
MASYNDGLYTPWTPAGEAAVATTSVAVNAAAPTTTSEQAWWITTSEQAGSSSTSMTTSAASSWTPSSSTASPTTTSSSSSASSSSSSQPPSSSSSSSLALSSSSLSASSSLNPHATLSRYVNDPSASASAPAASSSSHSGFKITYLIPVFVGLPLICIFALAGATYGRCWARPGSRGTPLTDRGGAGGSGWGSWRSRRRDLDGADEEATGGLVEKAAYPSGSLAAAGGAGGEGPEAPVMVKSASRWSNLFHGSKARPDVPFVSVSYASLEKPFNPPSRSSSIAGGLNRSASRTDRGWGWGMALPRASSKADGLAAQQRAEENEKDNQHLTADGVWGMGTTSRRYRPRGGEGGGSTRSKGSVSSRLTDKIFGRGGSGGGGLTVPDEMPSPSVYSPAFEPAPQMGKYSQLGHGVDEDDEDAVEHVDLDAFLGAGRVGGDDLAKRYMRGDVSHEELYAGRPPPPQANPFSQPRDAVPSFKVDLPAAPSRLQVSPKKSKSTLLRSAPTDGPGQLLFNYSSPPVSPEKKRPLPSVPSSNSRSSPTRGLTDPPPRVPFRQQSPPKLSRPPRSSSVPQGDPFGSVAAAPPPRMTSTPFSPETQPALFFASPPMSPHASSHPHSRSGSSSGHGQVGSLMPPYEPGALRASESAFSLAGMDALVYGTDDHTGVGAGGGGLKDLLAEEERRADPGKKRRTEIEQLRQSAPEIRPGMVVKSAVALQQSKARPVSHHQQQPSKPQDRLRKNPSKQDLQKRQSLGFDPSFGEGPAIAPLQHPSKVKAAIETLEKRSSREVPPPSPTQPSASSSTRAPLPTKQKREQHHLPAPPAPQRLERSSTTIKPPPGASSATARTYRRPLGGGRREGDYSDEEGDEEKIAQKRRVSMLILQRSRSQSADGGERLGLAGLAGADSGSSEGHGSGEERKPLSADRERLSKMLRRTSSAGGGLGIDVDDGEEDGARRTESTVAAMTRRSAAY